MDIRQPIYSYHYHTLIGSLHIEDIGIAVRKERAIFTIRLSHKKGMDNSCELANRERYWVPKFV